MLFRSPHDRPPPGALLAIKINDGSGTGKSELVKKIAGKVGMKCLFSDSAALLLRGEVGGTQKVLTSLWLRARATPYRLHYIFFDEIESIASSRDQVHLPNSRHLINCRLTSDSVEQVDRQEYKKDYTGALLTLISNPPTNNVLVIGATNFRAQ